MKLEPIDIRGAYTETVPTFAPAGRRRPFAEEIRVLAPRQDAQVFCFGREGVGETVVLLVNFVQRTRYECAKSRKSHMPAGYIVVIRKCFLPALP